MTLSKLSIKAQRIPIPRLHGLPLGIIRKEPISAVNCFVYKIE